MTRSGLFQVLSNFLFLMFAAPASAQLAIWQAEIERGAVEVQGSAEPYAEITWEGEVVSQASPNGRFRFNTDILPPTCVGELGDGLQTVKVAIKHCGGRVIGFYVASQDRTMLPPGEFGSVQSFCDLGDYAVSGSWVVYADYFRITVNGIVGIGGTGQQTWVMSGVNEGTGDADIRVSAICADVPPAHRPW